MSINEQIDHIIQLLQNLKQVTPEISQETLSQESIDSDLSTTSEPTTRRKPKFWAEDIQVYPRKNKPGTFFTVRKRNVNGGKRRKTKRSYRK